MIEMTEKNNVVIEETATTEVMVEGMQATVQPMASVEPLASPVSIEPIPEEVEEVVVKPYTFRKLSSPDIFPMFKIIGKIGLKEFTAAIDKDVLKELIVSFSEGNGEESFAVNGATVILGIADVIISKIPNCENDIYQILSQTSGMSIDEIKSLEAAVFLEMVIDFIKKEEFKDFFKVVSKLFK